MITSLRFFASIDEASPEQVLALADALKAPPVPRRTEQMFRCKKPQGIMYIQQEVLPNGALASLWRSDGGTEYIHIENFAGASWWRLEAIGG